MRTNVRVGAFEAQDSLPDFSGRIRSEIDESIAVKQSLSIQGVESIDQAARKIIERLSAGGKLIAFGNGGSAADAQHLVAELVGRFLADRKPFAAIALTTNSSSLTSIANDYGFDQVFARQVEALAKSDDVVCAISTSGNSANILAALQAAKAIGCACVGLTGETGGDMASLVDVLIRVPSPSTPRIQEAHGLVVHVLSGLIEIALTSEKQAQHSASPVTMVRKS
jgi:D-sedoheptulose 7-phosphate isomerase